MCHPSSPHPPLEFSPTDAAPVGGMTARPARYRVQQGSKLGTRVPSQSTNKTDRSITMATKKLDATLPTHTPVVKASWLLRRAADQFEQLGD